MPMSVVYTTINGEILHEIRNGVEHYYVPDTNGNTVQLLDAAGNKTDEWTYWPFGEVRTRTGTTATPFTFGGVLGYYLDMLGNRMYVRARYLRQALARWQTVDPLWPTELPYIYADNAPNSKIDPSGNAVCSYLLDWGAMECTPAVGPKFTAVPAKIEQYKADCKGGCRHVCTIDATAKGHAYGIGPNLQSYFDSLEVSCDCPFGNLVCGQTLAQISFNTVLGVLSGFMPKLLKVTGHDGQLIRCKAEATWTVDIGYCVPIISPGPPNSDGGVGHGHPVI